MIAAWYNLLLEDIKRNGQINQSESPDHVDMTLIKGVHSHKLSFWFGAKAKLDKYTIPRDEDGIDWENLPFDYKNVTAAWAKPRSGAVYVLTVPGHTGPDYPANLQSLGLEVDPGPKLFKRLKRAFGVLTIASRGNFKYRIERKEAPKRVTDGMCFASARFLQSMLHEVVRTGDVFQYSMLTPDGMSKGTCVALDDLDTDVVIPGEHNVKTELRSKTQSLFCIEGYQLPKQAKTDIQTMIHCGTGLEFEHSFYAELDKLADLAENLDASGELYWSEYESHDWFSAALVAADRAGTPPPKYETRPILSWAHAMEIDIRVSPTLRRELFNWASKRINIKRLKAPARGTRAYVIPDLSQFDHTTGAFRPDPSRAIRPDCIAFPKTSEGPVAVIRQPNGMGEATLTNNVVPAVTSQGVQVSILACDPELAASYPTFRAPKRSLLDHHGGMDFDDSLVCYCAPEVVTAVHHRINEVRALGLVHSNMEELVDAAVQNNDAPFTGPGQVGVAMHSQEMNLGQAVNFMMNLALVQDWEAYNHAASSKDINELAWAETQYLNPPTGLPVYADCWRPESESEFDPFARVPIQEYGDESTPFSYYHTAEYPTELGRMMREAGDAMDNLITTVRTFKDMEQQAALCSPEGMAFLRRCITRLGTEGIQLGEALFSIYLKLTGREPDYRGPYSALVNSYEVVLDNDVDAEFRRRELGVAANALLAGRTEAEAIAATAILAIGIMDKAKRWHGPDGQKEPYYGYGSDWWLFAAARDDDHNIIMEGNTPAKGLLQYWLAILKRYCNELGL